MPATSANTPCPLCGKSYLHVDRHIIQKHESLRLVRVYVKDEMYGDDEYIPKQYYDNNAFVDEWVHPLYYAGTKLEACAQYGYGESGNYGEKISNDIAMTLYRFPESLRAALKQDGIVLIYKEGEQWNDAVVPVARYYKDFKSSVFEDEPIDDKWTTGKHKNSIKVVAERIME